MKVIVFTDVEARALLAQLELEMMRKSHHWPAHSNAPEKEIEAAHRAFHHIVCRWLQDLGAEVVRL